MLLTRRLFLWLLAVGLTPAERAAEPVRIFAAASLKDALDQAIKAWETKTGKQAAASYAASSALAKQIEQAAPADIFMSADLDWMDYLDKKHLIRSKTRKNLLGNELVLVAAAGSGLKLDLEPG